MKPPMIPHQGRAIDTINFRNVRESGSLELGNNANFLKGVPLDSGMATPAGEIEDPFLEFNSVTLYHDDEDMQATTHEGPLPNGR